MSKPPPPGDALPESFPSGPVDARFSSNPMALLTNTGTQMAELGSHTEQLGHYDSKPQPRDITRMLRLGSQMVHASSLFLDDTCSSNATVASTPGRRKASVEEQDNANKRTRFAMPFPIATPHKVTPSSHTFIRCTGPTPAVTPSSSADALDGQVHPRFFHPAPTDEVDKNLWNVFSKEASNRNFDMEFTPVDAFVEDLTSTDLGKKRKQDTPKKEVAYLMKMVAGTNETLEKYFDHHDGNLIYLGRRGAHNNHHPGNRAYRDFILSRVENNRSLSREGKEELTNSVVQEFESQGRRLFKLDGNEEWVELDLRSARAKIRAKVSQRFHDT